MNIKVCDNNQSPPPLLVISTMSKEKPSFTLFFLLQLSISALLQENATNTKIVPIKILIDLEAYGLVSEGIEVVESLDSLSSLDIQSCYLPGQNDTPEKISYQNLHSHSPASSGYTDPFGTQ